MYGPLHVLNMGSEGDEAESKRFELELEWRGGLLPLTIFFLNFPLHEYGATISVDFVFFFYRSCISNPFS